MLLCASFSTPEAADKQVAAKHSGDLIIKFRRQATDAEIAHSVRQGNLLLRRHVQTAPMRRDADIGLTLAASRLPIEQALARLKNHPAIEYIEPNYTYTHQATANDPLFTGGSLWGVYGDLSSPANSYGSQAAEAWAQGHVGTNSVYVAVIDEGVQINHPDLAPNIWTNAFDPVDGLDNDSNGYTDDVNGWNFQAETSVVFDPSGDVHGTHVAGTIGARGGNGVGVAGVNWNVTMIPAKFMTNGSGTTLDAVEAIDYCVDLRTRHGINLVAINASWGGGGYAQSLHKAILRAAKAGILFVAAAGNGTNDNDVAASYPANINTLQGAPGESAASFNAVISVAAINQTGALATFSNWGSNTVHLGAPGVSIVSTYPSNIYAGFNGTSMAAPHVSGAAALYASTHPAASAEEIREALLGSVIATPSLTGLTTTGGRLDLSSIIMPPEITVIATDATAGEPATGEGDGTFTLTRTGSTAAELTVNFTVTGTATSDSDYTGIGTSVTFAAGSATATNTVNVTDDGLIEGDETVILNLIADSGYVVADPASATLTIKDDDFAEVVGRYVLYNGSGFDGNDAAANAADDAAIALDKVPLFRGQTASFTNYSSFYRGINGLVIDLSGGLAGEPSIDDFEFRVGNNNDPAGWATAPAPSGITLRNGAGVSGSDRITIIWPDNAIQKQWIEVTVLPTANTRLAGADVFYFGNAIADCGNSTANAQVDVSDENAARQNPRNFLNPASISNVHDYNRDKRVDVSDENLARIHKSNFLNALKLIVLPE